MKCLDFGAIVLIQMITFPTRIETKKKKHANVKTEEEKKKKHQTYNDEKTTVNSGQIIEFRLFICLQAKYPNQKSFIFFTFFV